MRARSKADIDALKQIAIGYGFRYVKRDLRWKIERVCKDILFYRKVVARLEAKEEQHLERIRELELEISNLDHKLRG